MNVSIEPNKKRSYFQPQIVRVELDNEISLALQSEPPVGPEESFNSGPKYLNNNPFRC